MEFLARCFELDQASWAVLMILSGAGYVLLSQMIGEHGPAVLGKPILAVCAAIGNRAIVDMGLVAASDKVMNMVVGMTGGMLIGAIFLVGLLWSWNATMAR
jgi:hypothetical protein